MHKNYGQKLFMKFAAFALAVTMLPAPVSILQPMPVMAAEGTNHTIENDSLRFEIGNLGQILTMNIKNNPLNRNNADINFVGSQRSWPTNAAQVRDTNHQWMGEMIFSTRSAATREGLAGQSFTEVDTNKTLAAGQSTAADTININNPYFNKTADGEKVDMTFNGGEDPTAGSRRMQDFKVDSTFNAETEDGSVLWEITITNKDDANFIEFGDIGLPMTWNTRYAGVNDTYDNRLSLHSFAGADSGYVYGIRTSGEGNYMMFTPVPETGAKIEYMEHWKSNNNALVNTIRNNFINWTGDGGSWFPGLSVAYIHSKSIRERDGASYFKSEDASSLILAPGESKTYQFKFSAVRGGDNEPGESAASPQNASTKVEERETNHRTILYNEGLIDAVAVPSFQTALNMPTKLNLHYDDAKIRNVELDIQSVFENDPFDTDHIPRNNNNLVNGARGGRGLQGGNPGYTESIGEPVKVVDERGESNFVYDLSFAEIGNNSVHIDYELFDGENWVPKTTQYEFNVLTELDAAVNTHADFMVDYQQDKNPDSPEYGIYDDWFFRSGVDTNRSHWGDDWSHDNANFMMMKNYLNPDPEQIESLELYMIDFLWNNYMKFTQESMIPANWLRDSGIYGTSMVPYERPFSRVMMATTFYNMYRIQKAYPELLQYRQSRNWYLEIAAGIANQLPTNAIGYYGQQQFPEMIEALYAEGLTALGNTLKSRFAQDKASSMARAAYPYGSEFECDNTGEESAYAAAKAMRTYYPENQYASGANTMMDKTDWKTRAMRGLQPTWFGYGVPVFRGGEGWWNFQYSASLAGYIMDDWLRYENDVNQYDNDSRAWANRVNYAGKISNFNAINMGQISPDYIGNVSWRYTMDKGAFGAQNVNDNGTRIMNNGWNDFSGESDEGLYGSLLSISTDVITDPLFGLYAYGGTVAKEDGVYTIESKDGFGKRLNLLDEMLYVTAESDKYTTAVIAEDGSSIELAMENQTGIEHMSKFVFYGLNDGFYSIAVDGEAAGQFFVEDGQGIAYAPVGEEDFDIAFAEMAGGAAQPATVAIVAQTDNIPAKEELYLDGLVYSDGSEDITSYAWETVSAPEGGAMTFTPANTLLTTARASKAGEYVVRFTAVIGGVSYSAEKILTVLEALPPTPPTVDAMDYEINENDTNYISMSADVSNGERDKREIEYEWSIVSTPEGGQAVLVPVDNPSTLQGDAGNPYWYHETKMDAVASKKGVYVFRVTAIDGTASASKDIEVEVATDISYEAISVVTSKGIAPVLPMVDAISNGVFAPQEVTWNAVDPAAYANVSDFKVEGVLAGTDTAVSVRVYVVENKDNVTNYAPTAETDGIVEDPGDLGGYAAMQSLDVPARSNNAGIHGLAWHNWAGDETAPAWVSYEWADPVVMDRTEIYVFKDNGGSFQPTNFRLQLRDENGEWYVPRGLDTDDLGNALDKFNVTTFEPGYVTGMRLDMEPLTIGCGIARWWAFGYSGFGGVIINKDALTELCDLYTELNSGRSRITNWADSGISDVYQSADAVRRSAKATLEEVESATAALKAALGSLIPASVAAENGNLPNLAFVGKRGGSYTSTWESLASINNNNITTANHWGSWDNNSETEWISYSWPSGAKVTGDNLHIWTDNGGIHIPQQLRYEYLPMDSDEWQPLVTFNSDDINAEYEEGSGVSIAYPNPHSFEETIMRGLRVTYYEAGKRGNGFGATEWQVFGTLGVPEEPVPVEGIAFTYGEDEAEALLAGETLSVNATLVDVGETPLSMYFAIYDGQGKLVSVTLTGGTIENGVAAFNDDVEIPAALGAGATAKVFFWETASFIPVRPATDF